MSTETTNDMLIGVKFHKIENRSVGRIRSENPIATKTNCAKIVDVRSLYEIESINLILY